MHRARCHSFFFGVAVIMSFSSSVGFSSQMSWSFSFRFSCLVMKIGIVVFSELLFGEALVRVVVFSFFMVHHLLHGRLIT